MTSLDTACMTEQVIDEYLCDYTFDDVGGYRPTGPELDLIKDAIMGLLVDQNFLDSFAPLTEPELRAGVALQLREIERLRVQVKQADERVRVLREACQAVDDLIKYQYTGTREGMTVLQMVSDQCRAALDTTK